MGRPSLAAARRCGGTASASPSGCSAASWRGRGRGPGGAAAADAQGRPDRRARRLNDDGGDAAFDQRPQVGAGSSRVRGAVAAGAAGRDPAPGPASRAECGGLDRDAGYWARRFAQTRQPAGAGGESRDRAVVPSAAELVEQLKEIARLRAQGALGRAPRAEQLPHKTPTIKRWLAAPPFTQHLTATSFLGLLNIVERWFAELSTKLLRGGNRSVQASTPTSEPGSKPGKTTHGPPSGPSPPNRSSTRSPPTATESIHHDTSAQMSVTRPVPESGAIRSPSASNV